MYFTQVMFDIQLTEFWTALRLSIFGFENTFFVAPSCPTTPTTVYIPSTFRQGYTVNPKVATRQPLPLKY